MEEPSADRGADRFGPVAHPACGRDGRWSGSSHPDWSWRAADQAALFPSNHGRHVPCSLLGPIGPVFCGPYDRIAGRASPQAPFRPQGMDNAGQGLACGACRGPSADQRVFAHLNPSGGHAGRGVRLVCRSVGEPLVTRFPCGAINPMQVRSGTFAVPTSTCPIHVLWSFPALLFCFPIAPHRPRGAWRRERSRTTPRATPPPWTDTVPHAPRKRSSRTCTSTSRWICRRTGSPVRRAMRWRMATVLGWFWTRMA